MSFVQQMSEHANGANNRVARAIDQVRLADIELRDALSHQREVLKALRAVFPDSYEVTRGATLEARAGEARK